ISLMDEAFTTVANLDEAAAETFVKKHADEERHEGAYERRSTTRIFGSKPGAYGAGLLPLMDARNWRTDEDLAEVYADGREWLGDADWFDAHTHMGSNDPDGVTATPEEILAGLDDAGHRRALIFPMHEPGGYPAANDAVLAAAAGSSGRLTALCRVQPRAGGAVREAERCLQAGARGIKLHPRAERFSLSAPPVRQLVALAHERRAPVLIHAGRGIPALGRDTVRLADAFPGARLILAHAAISDLAWLHRLLPDHPNVFVDTSWWNPTDLLAVFCLVPPGQVLWASDSPYGRPLPSALQTLRCALETGLEHDQIASVFGGQVQRLLTGQDALDLGPAPGPSPPVDLLLERVGAHITAAMGRAFAGGDPAESTGLARLAAGVGDAHPQADVFAAILWLLDLFEEHLAPPAPGRAFPEAARFMVAALILARTPRAVLPPQIAARDADADATHAHAARGETAS
ncbi:MAG: amidohydrolase family protein, partial [Actinobacteria bacterium]|nr:amidohydrolase family protein [Actinomycetota bacterium]